MCGDTQLTPTAPSAQVLAATINSLDSSHQVNPMSLAPLAPVCFVLVQTAGLGPKGGTFLHLLYISASPRKFFQRILQTLEPSMGNMGGPWQECRPGPNA